MKNDRNLDLTIKAIFQRVFEVPPTGITNETRRGELERWDSLGHLVLLEALREEFAIEIPPEQALEMETFGDIKRVIATLREAGESR